MDIDYSKYYWKNDLITLRQSKEEDWPYLCQSFYCSENRFMFDGEIELPLDVEGFKKQYMQKMQMQSDYVPFTILDRNEKHVGIANIFGINERHGCFGPVGVQINYADRGNGYAFATLRMIGKYMFSERRMHKWESGCTRGNIASESLHKKLGFLQEGIRRQNTYHNGQYWDEILFGMTKEEFFLSQEHDQL